jgi:hypothetical protein
MVYSSTIGTFRSLLTRAAGEKGVLTQKDVENIEKALPQFGDPEDVWRQKLLNLRGLYSSIATGVVEAYGGVPLQSDRTNELPQSDRTVWKQNPDGSYTRIK